MENHPQDRYSETRRNSRDEDEEEDAESSSSQVDGEESEEILPDFVGHLARFEEFRRNKVLTDVVFRGTDKSTEDVELHAHKVILAIASSYFQELFQDGKSTYEIPFPTEVLEDILMFIYTGRVPIINEENLDSIMVLAHTFNLPELLSRCRQILKTILTVENYRKFENVIKMLPTGDETILQLMSSDFVNFTKSSEFIWMSFDKMKEIVGYKDPMASPIPSASLLQGILTWVQAEIHSRQKHLLSLMQFVNLEEVPAEIMKRCMITLNTSYKKEGPSTTESMTFHSEVEEPPPQPEPPETPAEIPEKKHRKTRRSRRKTVPGDKTDTLLNEVSNTTANTETSEERAMSTEKLASNLKVFIMKEGSKEARVVLKRESLELPKKRSNTDSDLKENVKKPRISKSSEGLEKKLRSTNKHQAEAGVDYTTGGGIANISIGHPLMFYVCQKEGNAKDIMVYDFTSKEAGVLIENACLDTSRCQMAYLNRKLYFIGGKSDQGVQENKCLDSVLCYQDFPKITDTGLLQKVKWLGNTPIYASDRLQEARSDCGVIVWENTIYALGGRGENPSIIRSLNSCEKFQTGGSGWSKIKPMSKNRESFGIGTLDNSIYVIGGWISCTSTSCALGMVERYNPELDQWKISAPLLTRRCGVRVATANSCLYAIGGSEKIDGPGKLSNIEFYDTRMKYWMPIKTRSAMPFTCREGAVTTLGGKIISVECSTEEVNGRPLIEVFDPRARKWYTDGTLPTNGLFSSATFMNIT